MLEWDFVRGGSNLTVEGSDNRRDADLITNARVSEQPGGESLGTILMKVTRRHTTNYSGGRLASRRAIRCASSATPLSSFHFILHQTLHP